MRSRCRGWSSSRLNRPRSSHSDENTASLPVSRSKTAARQVESCLRQMPREHHVLCAVRWLCSLYGTRSYGDCLAMIKACDQVSWILDENGTVTFYLIKENKTMNLDEFRKWLDRFR